MKVEQLRDEQEYVPEEEIEKVERELEESGQIEADESEIKGVEREVETG